jgi:ComF family protein
MITTYLLILTSFIATILEGIKGIFFPNICIACKDGLPGSDHLICTYCSSERFEDPNPDRLSSLPLVILPESVQFQDAMWLFDRTGGLRTLLHALKYDGLVRLGHDLGFLMYVQMFCRRLEHQTWTPENTVILPVPMHSFRKRRRGYNQAAEIAIGFSKASGIPILEENVVVRSRFTRSQTGFSQSRRAQNVRSAFTVTSPDCLLHRKVLIIDDVFTTGATTFELAQTLKAYGVESCGILTVAAT